MLRIAIVTGSTRPNRKSLEVAQWVTRLARQRDDAQFDLVDIADFKLPLLDEPQPPSLGQASHEHTKRWAETVARFDAFVFVTPEYNHGIPAALKNAIDFVFAEWNDKAAGFVSYGSAGGARAVEQLRLVLAEVSVATIRVQVMLSLATDFENYETLAPHPRHQESLARMLDQLVSWGTALSSVRMGDPE